MTILNVRIVSLREATGRLVWPVAVITLSLLAAAFVDSPWLMRLTFAAAFAGIVAAVGLRSPKKLMIALVFWLVPLALLRRLLNTTNSSAGGLPDPLLLVGPFMLVVATVGANAAGAFRQLTALSKVMLALSALILLSTLNPLQGSLLTGVSSLVFYIPLLAFWIGRSLVDDRLLNRLLSIFAVLAVPAAGYGLLQVLVGLPSWDRRWVDSIGQTSLAVHGALRPFANFSSSAEFGIYLAIAVIAWPLLRPLRIALPFRLAISGLLVTAIVLDASRGIIVVLLAALGVVYGARMRLPLLPTVAIGAALVIALPSIVSRVAPTTFGQSQASVLLQHEVNGLSNPLDPNTSTAGIHLSLIMHGVRSAFTKPAGLGAGAVTIAGQKFGGIAAGTEADPSNAAVAFGLPGLLLYLVLLVLALRTAYAVAVGRRDALSLVVLGVLVVTILQWLNGGQYAIAFLPWLVLGWADRARLELPRPGRVAPPPGPRIVE